MREKLLATALVAGLTIACAEKPKQIVPTPVANATTVVPFGPQPPETPFLQIDAEKDLILETAQFFCQSINCNKTPEELADNVFFVPFEKFIQQLEKEFGESLTVTEKAEERMGRLEFTTDSGQVFINAQLFEDTVRGLNSFLSPRAIDQLKNETNPRQAILETVLIHAFSHVVEAKQKYKFAPFSLRVGKIGVPKIETLEGFEFTAQQENGRPFFLKSNEATTELVARTIGRRNGLYIDLVENYTNGAEMIKAINKLAGIPPQDFLQYATGVRPQQELFQKWGSLRNPNNPDEKGAVMALAAIGLHIHRTTNYEGTKQLVESSLGVRLP